MQKNRIHVACVGEFSHSLTLSHPLSYFFFSTHLSFFPLSPSSSSLHNEKPTVKRSIDHKKVHKSGIKQSSLLVCRKKIHVWVYKTYCSSFFARKEWFQYFFNDLSLSFFLLFFNLLPFLSLSLSLILSLRGWNNCE